MWIVVASRPGQAFYEGPAGSLESVTVSLRVVLDQVVNPTSPDLAAASRHLLAALTETAPSGCEVSGIMPGGRAAEARDGAAVAELASIWRAPVGRRELAAAWRVGAGLAAGGMIHSPTLMAPLVRHDRAHDHDQTVVTLWSLEPWTGPEGLDRGDVAWQRAMLKRAVRFADAVVVPTHAMAAELAEIVPLGARIRVIAGAPGAEVRRAADGTPAPRVLGLPERYVVLAGPVRHLSAALRAAAGTGIDVVVLADEGDDPAQILAVAQGEGVSEDRLLAPHMPEASERAHVLANALVVVAPSEASTFPWRALEALAAGAPLVAAHTAQNEELFADGAQLVNPADHDDLGEAVRSIIEDETLAARLKILSSDRARAFSWRDAAERVWQLHAEL